MMANGLLILIKLISPKKEENGFTLIELILVLMIFGILCAIAVPKFSSVTNKAKQKEASVIVSSIIKSAKAHQAEWGSLPLNMGEISQYAKFQKCIATDVENQGATVCKEGISVEVFNNEDQFFSQSGNYHIEIQTSSNPLNFQVKANPNGKIYAKEGSAVVGCYNPELKVSQIIEYTSKIEDKGIKQHIRCESGPQLPLNESLAFGPDSGLSCREAKSLPAGISSEYVYLSGRSRLSVPIVPVDISIGNSSWRVEGVTSPIDNTYSDRRWLETFAEEAASVINNSEGEYSAEIDPNNSQSIKIYGPTGNLQNDIEMKIDISERSRLSRGVYPYAVPSLGNFNDNWDNNKQAYVMPDDSNGETTGVCDGR